MIGGVTPSLLSPPHLVLYAGIVLVLTAAAVGVTAAATSGESLLRRLQQSPPLTAIVLATLFELSSAPIDEYWHRTFGRDVTVLSPPHLILIFGAATTFLALATLQLRQIKELQQTDRTVSLLDHLTLLVLITFATGMLLGTMVENDFPGIPRWHPSQRRDPWIYPAVVTLASAFGLTLAARVGRLPGSATWVAAILMAIRLSSAGLLLIGGWTRPYGPALLVSAAVVLDLLLGRVGRPQGAVGTAGSGQADRRRIVRQRSERWAKLIGAGLLYGLVLWVVAAGWQSLTGLPGVSLPAVVSSAWLLAMVAIVGTLMGYWTAGLMEWLSEPRIDPSTSHQPALEPVAAPSATTA